jgi:hypothetical protein
MRRFSDHCTGSPKGERGEKEIEKRKIIGISMKPKRLSAEFRRHTCGSIFFLPQARSLEMLKGHRVNSAVDILPSKK